MTRLMVEHRVVVRQNQSKRWGIVGLLFLLLSCACLSVFIGTRFVAPSVTWQAITAFDPSSSEHLLVHYLRIPRTLLAMVVGGALGVAGAMMQALTRNPLADPGILGVNAGATVAIVSAIALFGITDVFGYMWFGLVGATMAGGAVYLLAGLRRGINPVRVVLAGSALSVVLLALTHIITVNSDQEVFNQFRHWAVGSLQGRGYDVLWPVSLLVAVGLAFSMALRQALNTVSLGQDLGEALGVNPQRIWLLASSVIVVLSGAATSAAGPLSFVGLTAPHLARFWVGPDHRWLLLYSMLIASLLTVIADILGRVIGYPDEISVGIMIALIGGPFFVVLVRKWKIAQL
ncbi:FecCD family ABC transporter permease [Vibrio cincinnatiensis]|uniref:FecCD family ABC transporter permease n=1 Tax=Vibrio cincinnatiensis TaxID=675 RepID=UPI001EDE4062|nr:iron ABC transporter permease [Vibrio cincinnatiensis]MCG3731747.1 iron ABC transporter permease [Vibrio cincinnatiensis]MCG3739443.1 iron ABC transporter permease [Vibrio cincinnatiensis]